LPIQLAFVFFQFHLKLIFLLNINTLMAKKILMCTLYLHFNKILPFRKDESRLLFLEFEWAWFIRFTPIEILMIAE